MWNIPCTYTRYVPHPHDFSLGHLLMCEKSAFVTQVQNGPSTGTRSNIKGKTLGSSKILTSEDRYPKTFRLVKKRDFFHEVSSPVFPKIVINLMAQFNEAKVMHFRIINHRKISKM